jgi:hypothetical protein
VRTGDLALGHVLDALERLGLTDRTVVAYTADHGEELFDHGLIQHGSNLFQESMHVPLVLAGPGVPAGLRVGVPVSNRHLAPALASSRVRPAHGARRARPPRRRSRADTTERDVVFSTAHGWWNSLSASRSTACAAALGVAGRPGSALGREEAGRARCPRSGAAHCTPAEREDLSAREPERADDMQAACRS